jgi:polyvinyl alcohol dehydrogenase (cytochrome)
MPAPLYARSLALAAMAAAAGTTAPIAVRAESVSCAAPAAPLALGSAQWNGWGRGVENTRYQPEPAIRATDVPKLALKWAYGYAGSIVSGQPTIVDGRVFVTGATGQVVALDAKTGCTYWSYFAQAGVRAAVIVGELEAPRKAPRPKKSKTRLTLAHVDEPKAPTAVIFGDDKGAVYALDAQRGTLLWKTQVDAHPLARIQAAPTIYEGRVYVAVASSEPSAAAEASYVCCTFRGALAALDLANGHVVWKSFTLPEAPQPAREPKSGRQQFVPSGVPILGTPTVDTIRGVVYVGTGSTYTSTAAAADQSLAEAIVAFNLSDGKVRWAKQPAAPAAEAVPSAPAGFDASPILRTLANGKQILLAAQRSGVVYGLDPERAGEVLWQQNLRTEGTPVGGVVWGAAADHRDLYVALSGLIADPPDMAGSLSALDLGTGARRWRIAAPTPACSWGAQGCPHGQSQAVTIIPGIVFSGSLDGHLRAHSSIDGKIVWDYDTAKDFATVNHVKASGGSLDQGGATIVNGVLYINSGYGERIGQPGNVLLAFSIDGK